MEFLYINFVSDEFKIQNEFYYFISNFLIGSKTYNHSNIGFLLNIIKNTKILSIEELIFHTEEYAFQVGIDKEINFKEMYLGIDTVKNNLKIYNKLKKEKRLVKKDFEFVQKYLGLISNIRKSLYQFCINKLKDSGLSSLISLIDQNEFKIGYSVFNRGGVLNDDEITIEIINVLLNKEKILVLGSLLSDFSQLLNIEEIYELPSRVINEIEILTIPLVTMPCSTELTIDNIIILRKYFLKKFENLFVKIQNLRKELNKLNFNIGVKGKIIDFQNSIKKELQTLQEDINNHIYFQKIINSDSEYVNVTITIGVIPNETIGLFYTSINAISIEKAMEIKEKIDIEIGEDMCELFIFYNIEQMFNYL